MHCVGMGAADDGKFTLYCRLQLAALRDGNNLSSRGNKRTEKDDRLLPVLQQSPQSLPTRQGKGYAYKVSSLKQSKITPANEDSLKKSRRQT